MELLNQEVCEAFLRRFYNFYDGVVRSVRIDFESTPSTCSVVVDARDADSASGWSRIEFVVHEVGAFRFDAGRTTFEVLSSGIQVGWVNGQLLLVLDAYPDDVDFPDLATNRAHVAGASCSWAATRL
ncbi:MAG: hypothetical protein V4850_24800 [Myxococcota bacterium]